MKVILDTHAFLWFFVGDPRLSRKARQCIENATSELFLSLASIWEMAIKISLGRLTLPVSLDEYLDTKLTLGLHLLPIERDHATAVTSLPWHHRDPFDRMLIAQSIMEEIPILSGDTEFKKYKAKIIW